MHIALYWPMKTNTGSHIITDAGHGMPVVSEPVTANPSDQK